MLCSVKETVSHREKIFANHISDKELTPKVYKKILKNSKIRKQPNEEMGKRYMNNHHQGRYTDGK